MRSFLWVVFLSLLAINVAEAKRDFYVEREVNCGIGEMCYLLDGQPLNGKLRRYYPSGVVKQENEYRNGLKNGVQQKFYPDGKQRAYAVFLNGKLQGGASLYYNNGNVEYEEQFDNGVLHGVRYGYYEDGRLKLEEKYVSGVKDGKEKQYYEDGKPRAELWYDHGKITSAACWGYDGKKRDYTAEAEEYAKIGGNPCRAMKLKWL